MKNYHTAFGVYGIIFSQGALLVLKKNGGPYINRYDLPGGSQESGETLEETLIREVAEETGLQVTDYHQLGTVNFLYPWEFEQTNYNNHIAVFYSIDHVENKPQATVGQFVGQDSLGALWLPLDQITRENASLLVLKAQEYLQKGKFSTDGWRLNEWPVLAQPTF